MDFLPLPEAILLDLSLEAASAVDSAQIDAGNGVAANGGAIFTVMK